MHYKKLKYYTKRAFPIACLLVIMYIINGIQAQSMCKSIEVHIKGKPVMVRREAVMDSIFRSMPGIIGTKTVGLHLEELEKIIYKNHFVEEVNLFLDLDGNLIVRINQREPLIRIININNQSFYVDRHGLKMPLSEACSPAVLIANGFISEFFGNTDSLQTNTAKKLFTLAKYINKQENAFWKNQIQQIYVKQKDNLDLIPRIGNHKIELGTIDNLDSKFGKLMVFYKKALPRVGWNKYSIINLRYDNQIVAVRNSQL